MNEQYMLNKKMICTHGVHFSDLYSYLGYHVENKTFVNHNTYNVIKLRSLPMKF